MIIRVEKRECYTIIANEVINDKRLSWDARGLLIWLLSKPSDWKIRRDNLVHEGPAGKDKIARILAELESFGYLTRHKNHQADGTFIWENVVREEPVKLADSPVPENPALVNPSPVKPPLLSTKRESTEVQRTEEDKEAFDVFYSHYPNRQAPPAAFKAWKAQRLRPEDVPMLLADVEKRYRGVEKRFIPHPATYLNQRRWEGDLIENPEDTRDRELMAQRDRELTLVYGELDA